MTRLQNIIVRLLHYGERLGVRMRCNCLRMLFYHYQVSFKISILRGICCETIAKYRVATHGTGGGDSVIYTLWYQGRSGAPDIVKTCLSKMEMIGGYELKVLTKEDVELLDIDPIFKKRYQQGAIKLTHYSDIIRAYVLSHYGGIWADATLFVQELPQEIMTMDFYSVKRYVTNISDRFNPEILWDRETDAYYATWTAYFMSSRRNGIVTSFLYEMFKEYWTKCDSQLDNYLIDMVLRIGYEDIPEIRREIAKIPYNNNGHIHEMQSMLNVPFDEKVWDEMNRESKLNMFKLSYKGFCPIDDESTYYYHIKDAKTHSRI